MKNTCMFLLTFMVFVIEAHGQTNIYPKTYASGRLEYMKILDDSTLMTSIEREGQVAKYFIRADTMFIKEEHWDMYRNATTHKDVTEHVIEWHDYKIFKFNSDTLVVLNKFRAYERPEDWEDTLEFVSLENLKEPVTKFGYLKLNYTNPLSGVLKVRIDSTGKIIYERKPHFIFGDTTRTIITGEFTKEETLNFFDTFSYAAPSKLDSYKIECGTDASKIEFEIAFNGKIINSSACELKWINELLFNYLYHLIENKGFVNRRQE